MLIKKELDLKYEHKEVSSISKASFSKELRIKFYSSITNKQNNACEKSRRYIICQKIIIIYYNFYGKAYYYLVSRRKDDYRCLEDYIKNLNENNCFRIKRSYII